MLVAKFQSQNFSHKIFVTNFFFTKFQSHNFSHNLLSLLSQLTILSLLSLLSLLSQLSQLSQMSLLSLLSHRQVGRQVLITLQYSKGHFFTNITDRRTDRPTDGPTNGRTDERTAQQLDFQSFSGQLKIGPGLIS